MTSSVIRRFVVPGRVELVGKHVDYAGGRSLTCAVDRALRIDAEALREPVLRADAGPERGSVVMPLDASAAPTDASWSVYVAAVEELRGGLCHYRNTSPPSGRFAARASARCVQARYDLEVERDHLVAPSAKEV